MNKKDIDSKKTEFMLYEIWSLSISGAFQRANVYKECPPNTKEHQFEKVKNDFKKQLRIVVVEISKQYENIVSESNHILNIETLTSHNHSCLHNEYLNFGVSQKLLNLYLKYLWCSGFIPTPPHFPVDRLIQEKLFKKNLYNWTTMNKDNYTEIINRALQTSKVMHYSCIAEMELQEFVRRND
jgi:hypothetical protein